MNLTPAHMRLLSKLQDEDIRGMPVVEISVDDKRIMDDLEDNKLVQWLGSDYGDDSKYRITDKGRTTLLGGY